jgi:hypothetical protein
MIQKGLERANAEKNDLESMRSKLSNLLLGEEAPNEAAPPSAPAENEHGTDEESKPAEPSETSELPEPPVVVRVKSDAAQAS